MLLAPKGRESVATGGAQVAKGDRSGTRGKDERASSRPGRGGSGRDDSRHLRRCRGEGSGDTAFHGLRDIQNDIASPVATDLRPIG